MKPTLSIIIPVGNDQEGLRMTLTSLKKVASFAAFEVLICNDGAHSAIQKIALEFECTVVNILPNQGSYFARNEGIRKSSSDQIAFLDAGTQVSENWLIQIISALERADYVAGAIQHPVANLANACQVFQCYFSFPVREFFEKDGFGPTANLAIKRSVFDSLGLFDGRLRSGGDNEFGFRVKKSKLFIQVYNAECLVVHPYRNLNELIRKKIRTTMGMRQVKKLYPEIAAKIKSDWLYFARILFPKKAFYILFPTKTMSRYYQIDFQSVPIMVRLKVFFFIYFFKLFGLYARLIPFRRPDALEWDEAGNSL